MLPDLLSRALANLLTTVGVEGAAVLDLSKEPALLREVGLGGAVVLPGAARLLRAAAGACHGMTQDRRPMLACPMPLANDQRGALVLWKMPGEPAWTTRDHALAKAVAGQLRLILDHMRQDLGIDQSTGLPLRDRFLEIVDRRIARLDAAAATGTLLLVSPDSPGSAPTGADAVDVLVRTASLLHAILRPSDQIGRIGAGRLAAWLDDADHMTTAERAEAIVQRRLPEGDIAVAAVRRTFSIGIATRQPGSADDAAELLARATDAVETVHREGGNGWRVASHTDRHKD